MAATFEYCYKIHEGKSENAGAAIKTPPCWLPPPSPWQLTAKLQQKQKVSRTEILPMEIYFLWERKYKNHQSWAGDEPDWDSSPPVSSQDTELNWPHSWDLVEFKMIAALVCSVFSALGDNQ